MAPLPAVATRCVSGRFQVALGQTRPEHRTNDLDLVATLHGSPLGPVAVCLCDPLAMLSLLGLTEVLGALKPNVLRVTLGAVFLPVDACCVALRGLALFCPLWAEIPPLLGVLFEESKLSVVPKQL